MANPSVDITDFYTFVRPERPDNLVLIMDVFPLARRSRSSAMSSLTGFCCGRWRYLAAASRTVRQNVRLTSLSAMPGKTPRLRGHIVTSDGQEASFVVGKPLNRTGCGSSGLASDPFFMDVEAAIRTDVSGKLSFDTARNTAQRSKRDSLDTCSGSRRSDPPERLVPVPPGMGGVERPADRRAS